ncbi:MAG TPA: T9SS type A sorting domain-containing protein, partial [Cytophagales bacterium]|nr:T9SS type A sorting domain-containing protein [Cytophagales bacterium]
VVINNTANTYQSENSMAVSHINPLKAINSNNSNNSAGLLGTSGFMTNNQGASWPGSVNGTGGTNSGDPAAAISNNNRYYVGFINSAGGQGVAVSTNEGVNWTSYVVAASTSGWLLDKNHLWVDKSTTSAYQNNVYSSWVDLDGASPHYSHIMLSRSTSGGTTWSAPVKLSTAINAGSHNQGVNIATGPNGEVYAIWAVYDSWPSDETAIGFAKSTDGGVTFGPAQRIKTNIRGVRTTGVGKNMRVNSFPTMAVDNSFGPNRGSLYVTWANIGTPGVNTGNDADVYLIKSTNQGTSWSAATKVNTSVAGAGKKHYFPWIACDGFTGKLHIIYYDDRNVSATQIEAWMSSSFDGGSTWGDYKISDVAFTPSPIPGLAAGYFGDYLGLAAYNDVVYPVWTDNRTGAALAYTSPLLVSNDCPSNLTLQNINLPYAARYKYRAQNYINVAGGGTQFIMQGDNATTGARTSMVAGKAITFSGVTSIQKGTVFTAAIGACSSPLLRTESTSETAAQDAADLSEDLNASLLQITPNPASDVLHLNLKSEIPLDGGIVVVISDLMGRQLKTLNISSYATELNTTDLESGGYFLSIFSAGKRVETKRFIKL